MDAVNEWTRDYLRAWRELAGSASPERLAAVMAETTDLRGATAAIVVVATIGPRTVAFLVQLEPGEERCDGMRLDQLAKEDQDEQEEGGVRWLRQLHRRAELNWSGRNGPDPHFSPSARYSYAAGTKLTLVIPTGPGSLSPRELAEHQFREAAAGPAAVVSNISSGEVAHLFSMREKRERYSLERWLFGHAHELLAASGLQYGWWCALGPPRRDLFGNGDGDVDLVAGPLELALTPSERRARHLKEAEAYPLTHPPEVIQSAWLARALAEGLLVWPPRMENLVAWEAKASYFHDGKLKHTHAKGGHKLLGQLEVCLEQGIERVGYIHFVSTAPIPPSVGNPHLTAGRELESAFNQLPTIHEILANPVIGYVQAGMGAVEDHPEHFEGVGATHRLRPPTMNPHAAPTAAWRSSLQARLAELPAPTTFNTFLAVCSSCHAWYYSAMPAGCCPHCPRTEIGPLGDRHGSRG